MVRETRYLQIGNIPENTTEDEISEYFKRYGRIQSVKLHPKKENETIHLATVAFTDIKSASTAHRAENKLKNNVLKTDFSEGSATGSVVTRTREPDHFQRTPASSTFPNHSKGLEEVDGFDIYYGPTQATFPEENRQFQNWGRSRDRTPRGSSVVGGGNFNKFDRSNSWQGSQQWHFPEGQHRTASFEQHSTEKETFERPKAPASPAHSTSQASSRHSSRKKHSPSQSGSSSSRSSSSSSSSGSQSRSRSNSSQSSSRSSVKKKVASTAQKVVPRTEVQDDKNSSQEVPESGEREPHGIYITHLPMRSSDTSLRDGLFHEYKKYGKITAVQVSGVGDSRYAIVSFKKAEDAAKALEASQEKTFFGTKIIVAQHEGLEVDDAEFRPPEAELDEHHPKATRTLFIGNLEKDVTNQELREKFDTFGEILDIDVKRQGAVSAYAFVQYTDIRSVVRALREMEGETMNGNKIKLGFGKSMPTGCIWMDNLAETVTDNFLCRQFSRFGGISHAVVDRLKGQGLVFFDSMENAQFALPEMRNRIWNGRKIHIDFASRDCQDRFFVKMEESGQLREGDRPDTRRIFKQQVENYWEEGMEAEKYHATSSSAQPPPPPPVLNNATNSTSFVRGRSFNRRGGFNRGRGRGSGPGDRNWGRGGRFHNNFEEFSSPSSRRIQFEEYQASGTYPEENSYEQELRAYGFSQRERRERLSQSPGHYEDYDYEEGSQSGRNFERFEKYSKEGHFDSYRSDSPGSDVELCEEDAKYRTRDERYYKDKYYSEQVSRDRSVSSDKEQQKLRLSSDIASNRSWSPTSKEKRTKELPMSYRSQTPPTPTENEPVYHSRDHSPTDSAYRKYGDYKKRLSAGSGDGDKDTKSAVWNITLASTGLRKEIESVKTEERNARKRSYDEITNKGVVRHDLTVPNLERQSSRGSRTSSVDLDKLSAKVGKLKSEVYERTLGKLTGTSPSSGSSHGESEHGSLTESELLKLHKEKQLLLDKLKQLEDNGSTSDNESNELEDTRRVIAKKPRLDLTSQNVAKYLQKADKLGLSSQEKIRLLDVSKSCRKQMEDLRKHEVYLREQKAKNAVESAKKDTSFSDNEESHTVSPKDIPTGFLPKKRRKVDASDMEESIRSRFYRMRKDQEEEGMFSSEDEKDSKRSQITENIFKQSSTHSKDESRRISSGSESAKEHGDRVRRKEDYVPPIIPLGDDLPNPDLKDPRTCRTKMEDTTMSLPLPKFAQNLPHVASPLSSPVPHLSSKQFSDLPSHSAAAKSATKTDISQDLYDPSKPTETSDQSPCFSPQSSSSKTQSPSGSPPGSSSGNSKGNSDSVEGDYNGSQFKEMPEQKLEPPVGSKVEDSKEKPDLEDHDTFSDSNSEHSDSIDMENLSIEERIRRLDEKLCQAQVATATSKTLTSAALTSSPSSNVSTLASSTAVTTSPVASSLYSKFRIRKKNEPSLLGKETSEPSEIVKQVLSKSSVFDQDSKRLEQISEKYEPKEVSLNLDESPIKGPFRTKAAAKEMPLATLPGSLMERLGQTSSFPTLTVNTSLANQSFISVVTPNKFGESPLKDTSSSEVSTPKMSPAIDQNGESTRGSSYSSPNVNTMPSIDGPITPVYHYEGLDAEALPPKLETPSKSSINHSLWRPDDSDYQHLLIRAPELEKQENLDMSVHSPLKPLLATSASQNKELNSEMITSLNCSPLTLQICTSKASPRMSYSPLPTLAAKKEPFMGTKETDPLTKDTAEKKEIVPPKESIQDSTYKPEMFGVCIVKESAPKKDTGFEASSSKDMKQDAFNLDIFGMSTPLVFGKRKADESSKTESGGAEKPMDIDSSIDEKEVKTVNVSDDKIENVSVDAASNKPYTDKVKMTSEKKKTEKEAKKEILKQDSSKEPESKKMKSSKDKKSDSSKEEKHLKKSSSKDIDKKLEHHRSSSTSDKKEKDKQKAKSEKKDKDGDKKVKEKKDPEEKKEKDDKKEDKKEKDDKKEDKKEKDDKKEDKKEKDDKKEDKKEKEDKKKKDGEKKEEKEKEKKGEKKDEVKKIEKKDKPEKKDKDGEKKDSHRHDKHNSSKFPEKKMPKTSKDVSTDGKESTKDSDKKTKSSKSESSHKSKKPKEESSGDKSKDQEKDKAKDVEKKDINKEKKEQDREKKDMDKEKKENDKEKKEQDKEKRDQDREKKEQDKEKKEQDKEKTKQDKEKNEQDKEKNKQDKEKNEQEKEKNKQDKEKKEQDKEKKEQDKEKKEQVKEKKDTEKEVVKDQPTSDKSKENVLNEMTNDQNEKARETKEKSKDHIAEKCKDHKAKDHKEKDNKDPDVSKGSKAGTSSSEKSKSSSETKLVEKSKSDKDKPSKENSKTKSGGEKKSKDSSSKQSDSSSSKKTKESGDSEKKRSKSEKSSSKSSKSSSENSKDDSKSKEKESTEKKENDSSGNKKEKENSSKKEVDSTDKKDKEKEKNSSGKKKKERNSANYFAVELDFEPYMSMYDKVKRRSTEKDKEKEMEDVRRRFSKMQKGSRKKTSRSSDHSDDSMENSDEENTSVCTETKEEKKGKYIFESSSDLSNSSSEEAIFMSKPKGKIQTLKKKPKKFFDIYSSDSEEDEDVHKHPDKPKPKSPILKTATQKVEKNKFLADLDDVDIEMDSLSELDTKSDKLAKPKTSKPKKSNKATKSDKPASKEKKETKAKPQKQSSLLSDDSDVFFKDKGLSDTESELDVKPSKKVIKKQSDKKKSPPKGHSIYTTSEEDDDELFSKFSFSLNSNNKTSSQKVAEKEMLTEVKEHIELELKKSEPEKEPIKITEVSTDIPISDTEAKSLKSIKKLKDKDGKSIKKTKKTKKPEPKISNDSVVSEAESSVSNLLSRPETEVFSETVFEKDEPLVSSEELKIEKAAPVLSDKEVIKESSTRNIEDNEARSSKKGKKHKKEGKKKKKDQEEKNDNISKDLNISQKQNKRTLLEDLNMSDCLSGSSVCESDKVNDRVINRKNNLFDDLSNISNIVESAKIEETSFEPSESRDNIFDKMTNITQTSINIKPEKEGKKKPKKKKKNQKDDKKDSTKKDLNESKKENCEASHEKDLIAGSFKDEKSHDLSESKAELTNDFEVKLEKGDSKIENTSEPKDEKSLVQLEKAEKKNKKKEKSDKDNSNKSETVKSNKKKREESKSSTVSDIFEFTEEEEDSLLPLKDMHAKLHRSESGGSEKTQEELRDPGFGKTKTEDNNIGADKNKEDKVEENEFPEVEPKEVVIETKIEEKPEKSKSRPRKRKSRKNSNKGSEVSIEEILSPNVQTVEHQEEEIVPEPTDISEVEAITTEIESNKPDQTLEAVSNLEKENQSLKEEEQTVTEVVTFDPPVTEEQELVIDEGIPLHVEDETTKTVESLVEDETANAVASILPLDDMAAFSVSSTVSNQSSVQVEDTSFIGTQLNEAATPQVLPETQSIEIETSQPELEKSNATTPGRRKRGKGKRSKSQNKEELPAPESESQLSEIPNLTDQSQPETNQSTNQGFKSTQQDSEVSQADTFGLGFLSNLGQPDKNDDDDDAGMGRLQIDLEPPKQESTGKRRRGSKQAKNNKTTENRCLIVPSPARDEFDRLESTLQASLVEDSDDNKDSFNTDVETDNQFDTTKGDKEDDQRQDFDFLSPDQDDSLTDKRSRRGKRPKNYKEMNSGILSRTNSPRSKTLSPRSPRNAMSPKQLNKSQNSPKSEVTKAALKRINFVGQKGIKFEDSFDTPFGKEDSRHGKVQANVQEFSMFENEAAPDIAGDKSMENDKGHKTGTNVFDFNDDAELPLEPVTLQRNRGSRRKKGAEVISPELKAEQGSLMLSPEHNSSGSADDTKAVLVGPELKFVIGSPRHKADILGSPRHKFDSNTPSKKSDLGNLDLKMGIFSPQPITAAHVFDVQSEKKALEEEKKPEPLFKAYFDNLKLPKVCVKQEAEKVSAILEKRNAEEKHEDADVKKSNFIDYSSKVTPAPYSLETLKIVSPRTPATPMSNIDRIIDNVSKGIFDDIDAEKETPVLSSPSLMSPVTNTGVIKATNNSLLEGQGHDLSMATIEATNVAPALAVGKRRQTRNRKSSGEQTKAGHGPVMSPPMMSPPLTITTSPNVYTPGVRIAESSQASIVEPTVAASQSGFISSIPSPAFSKLGHPEAKKGQQAEEKQTVPALPPVTTNSESASVTFITTHQLVSKSTINSAVPATVSMGNSTTAISSATTAISSDITAISSATTTISSATTVVMATGLPQQAQVKVAEDLTKEHGKESALPLMREMAQTLPIPSETLPVSVPRLSNTQSQSQILQSQAPISQQTQVVTSLAEIQRRHDEELKRRMQQQILQQQQQQMQQQMQQQQLQMQQKQEQQQLQQKQQQHQQQIQNKPSEKPVQSVPSLQQTLQQDQLTKAGLGALCMPHNLPLFGIPPRHLPPHIFLANHAAQMAELATQAAHTQGQDKRGLMGGPGVLEPGQIHSQQHQIQQKQGLPPSSHPMEKMQQQAMEQQKLQQQQLEQKLQMEQKLQQQQLEQRLKEQQQMEQRIQEIHRHQQALAHQQQQQQQQHQQQQQQQQQQSKKQESQRGQGKKDNPRARASASQTNVSPQDQLPSHPSSHESMAQLPTAVHQQLKSPLPTHPGQPFKPGQGLPHPLHPWPQHLQPQVRPEGHREDVVNTSVDLARSSTGPTVSTGGMPITTTGQRVSPHPPTKSPTVAQMAPNMGIMYSQHQAGTQRAPSPQVAKTAERQTPGKWPSNSPGAVRPSIQLPDGRPRIPSAEASPTTPRDLWANLQNPGAPPRTPRPAHQQPPEGAPRPAHQKVPEHTLHAEIAKDPKFLQHREIQQEMHRQELLNLQRQEIQRQEMRQREQAAAVQVAQAQEREREREREREHARPDSRQSPSSIIVRDRLGYAFIEPRPPSQSDAKVPQSPSLIDSRFPQQYTNLPVGYHATDLRLGSTQAPSAFSPAAPGAEVAAHMYTPAEIQRLQQAGLGGYPIRVFEPHVQHPSYMIPAAVHPHLAYMAQHVEHQQLIEGRPSLSTSGALTPAHSISPTQSVPQEGRVPQGRQAHMGPARPLSETHPHPGDGSLLSLLQRYPVMWQGVLALKNDQCVVQMHFIAGWQPLVKMSLPQQEPDGSIQPLRIAQRMRLEPAQLEGVAKRMQMEKDFCMLLALPCGHDHTDIYQQTRAMSGGFIQYLQSKQAAGIVNVADRNMQPAYVVHIFPPCDFSHSTLSRLGFDLHYQVKDLAHLIIIIATVG